MSDEVLIKCENVSKKFCRNLKRSLWYGIQDICSELNPMRGVHDVGGIEHTPELRKNEFWAVNDVSFELKRGECIGLIGQNGAGKSTLLKMLNGLIKPDHGRITMKGRIGAIIELNAGFNPILTGRENVYVYGSILGLTKKEIDQKYDDIVEFAELEDFMEMPFRSYSSGMKVRLGFAVATQMEPDVLIIDEVLAVGDVGFKIKCINRIKNILQHSAVVFVSHSMQQISSICTAIILLNNGKSEFFSADIGMGIDNYFKRFSCPVKYIMSSDDITISEVYIQSGGNRVSGKEKLLFNHNDDVSIEMSLSLLNESINEIAIKIVIWDTQMHCIADCFTEFCNFKIRPEKESIIRLKLKNLNFSMGTYSVTVTVLNLSNKEVLARYDNVAFFQVSSSHTSWASVNLIGEWSQKSISLDH